MSIQIEGLTKSFGDQKAIDNISFSVQKGEVVGFLGPNGSGKSTTMRCICGILTAEKGSAKVSGLDVSKDLLAVKRIIGYLPEHNPLPHEMYVKEYLQHIDGYYNGSKGRKERMNHIIELTGLGMEQQKRIGQLSKGYRQRVGLAQAMIHNPEVLILDEPTTGLDPNQIIEIRNLISGIAKDKTVMLSTHILQEVEAICDRVIVLNNGKLVADGSAKAITEDQNQSGQTVYVEFKEEVRKKTLERIDGINTIEQIDRNAFLLAGMSGKDLRESVFQFALENQLIILSMQKKGDNLEAAFRKLTRQN